MSPASSLAQEVEDGNLGDKDHNSLPLILRPLFSSDLHFNLSSVEEILVG